MTKKDRIILVVGISLLGFPLSVLVWLGIGLSAWYVAKIPARILPFTTFLWSGQPKVYEWISGFLKSWLFWCFVWFASPVFLMLLIGLLIVGAVWLVNPINFANALGELAKLFLGLLPWLYILVFPVTAFAFWWVKRSRYDAQFQYAERSARLLIGDEAYERLNPNDQNALRRHIVDCEIGINKGTWIVAGGKTQTVSPPAGLFAKFGGPGILVVQQGHAVFLEKNGRVSRVVGVGIHFLQTFERPTMVIPLTGRATRVKVENLITQEGSIIKCFEGILFYKVNRGSGDQDRNEKYPFDLVELEKIWTPQGSDPADSVKSIAITAMRTVMAKHTLVEIFRDYHLTRQQLRDEWVDEANLVCNPFLGVSAFTAAIDNLEIPEETQATLWQKWSIGQEMIIQQTRNQISAENLRSLGAAEKDVLTQLEEAKSQARANMLRDIQRAIYQNGNIPRVMVPRFLEMLEKLSRDTMKDDITTKKELEVAEHVLSSAGEKHIYVNTTPGVTSSG